jgi:carboxyl-terminal processing protease
MNRAAKTITWILIILLTLTSGYVIGTKYPPSVIAGYLQPPDVFPKSLMRDHSLLTHTAELIEQYYYKPVKEDDLTAGMVNSLDDPYSVFFPPAQTKEFQEEVNGKYAGIGVVITENKKESLPMIISVFPNTPAEKSGLKSGDIIVKAGEKSLKGLSLDDVSNIVKGKIGTSINLLIKRGEKTFTVTVTREEIHIPLIKTSYLDNGKIGYLKINMFSKGVAYQVKKALNEMNKKKIKGLILDLRDDPGGLLSECSGVASMFVPSGPLLWTKGRDGEEKPLNITGTRFNLPLVVLVNSGTASAAEILTGAIKDYGVGTVIGTKTFGKGVIQQIFPLAKGYTLKLTVEEYLTAKKHEINKIGISPDILVKNDPKAPDKDLQMQKAIAIIKDKIGEK